jgi:hypothetical protein
VEEEKIFKENFDPSKNCLFFFERSVNERGPCPLSPSEKPGKPDQTGEDQIQSV